MTRQWNQTGDEWNKEIISRAFCRSSQHFKAREIYRIWTKRMKNYEHILQVHHLITFKINTDHVMILQREYHVVATAKTKRRSWRSLLVVFRCRHRRHLEHRTKEKKVFWEFDPITMQNMDHNLLLFCATTWPSYHLTENHVLYIEGKSSLS